MMKIHMSLAAEGGVEPPSCWYLASLLITVEHLCLERGKRCPEHHKPLRCFSASQRLYGLQSEDDPLLTTWARRCGLLPRRQWRASQECRGYTFSMQGIPDPCEPSRAEAAEGLVAERLGVAYPRIVAFCKVRSCCIYRELTLSRANTAGRSSVQRSSYVTYSPDSEGSYIWLAHS